MTEWWTYSPRDLLLFSPQTYYRLFELYNLELWPLQIPALLLGVGALALWWRGGEAAGRGIALILALCWLWVAWRFHWLHYASINPFARHAALAFVLQALLLIWLGALRGRLTPLPSTRLQFAGLGIVVFAVLVFPLLGPLLGRSWTQAEVFGMAPDPTALATLGVLSIVGLRPAWSLWPIPVAWSLVSGTTLWAMDAPEFALIPLLALLAVGVAVAGTKTVSRWSHG